MTYYLSFEDNMKRKSTSSTPQDESGAIDLIAQAPGNERKRSKKECNSIDQNAEQQKKQSDGNSGSRDKYGAGKKRKREKSNITGKRQKLRKKQAGGVVNGIETSIESADYISQLPEAVIHHILSLIRCRKGAARTSVLSKRWRDVWTTFSVLTFDQRKFQKPEHVQDKRKNEMFKDFIDRSLLSHLEKNLNIRKFELHLTSYDQEMARGLEHWVGLATENNIIKELGLHIHTRGRNVYNFPRKAFASDTLTGLRLQSCKLDPSCAIKLPHLQKLYLRDCNVDKQRMQNIISSCPLIEDLRLICCTGLKFLQLLGLLKLDRVEVHHCRGLKKIEVKAANLQTFWYCGKNRTACKLILSGCESLKRFTLEDKKMTDNQFRELFFGFPLLEKLDLSNCLKLKDIRIASHRLNRLVLRGCVNLQGVEIDTPNLLSFEYQGDKNQKMPFSFLNPICLKEAKLSFGSASAGQLKFDHNKDEPIWFKKLRDFLGKFDHNRGVKLVVHTIKNVIIYEDLREMSLPPVCGLKLEIINSSVGTEELLNSTLQKWHPETLSIASPSSSEFTKLVHEKMMESKKDPTCCTSKHPNNKCWRHSLKVGKKVNLKRAKGKSGWIAWLKSKLKSCPNDLHEITCFSLLKKSDMHGKKASS
uniref:uncharacterized protein LOC101299670 isoform X1 n=2 Tax=Fragaria vesca subsp. vesca TaxID=101020 RepID=UPI0005C9EBFE|nr:PREDICTED: uncharacterized protein LOC101299670 isoform X1 [Fragaria vesca subsp. vesca]